MLTAADQTCKKSKQGEITRHHVALIRQCDAIIRFRTGSKNTATSAYAERKMRDSASQLIKYPCFSKLRSPN